MKASTMFELDTTIRCLVISYSKVITYNVAADMLRDLVTLTFHLLTLVSERTYMASHVINPSTKFEDPTAIRSSVVLSSPIAYNWQCVCSHCACAVSRDLCVRGQIFPIYLKSLTQFAYSLYNFYGATIKTNGVIHQNSLWPCVKDHMRESTSALNVAVNAWPPSFSTITISR